MFSQADIIRTLENKNCKDQSVMSLAMSQDCTAQKLLEKLTEIERFDLALDISMRLGLDVTVLWRTWAMRCLKHRNFQSAREKFRHCFQRLRLRRSRVGPVQSHILADILSQLTKMDETHISLAEEVELIKLSQEDTSTSTDVQTLSGEDISRVRPKPSVKTKPTIYSECSYYLTEYGSTADRIRFYIRNSLWIEASQLLLDQPGEVNLSKFFIGEVVQYSTSTGCFNLLISALLKVDPKFSRSTIYFKSIYDFCLQYRRFNLLYYVQSTIGDYVAAANTQINIFFLRRPVQSYRELNHRIPSLVKARENYEKHLEKVRGRNKSESEIQEQECNQLFSVMDEVETKKKLRVIDLQIEITRNFAINEVSGCVTDIDLSTGFKDKEEDVSADVLDDSPVTLFERTEKRKIFLTALVLIYFDLSCSAYFSKNGLDIARQLIEEDKLDKIRVFKTAMRIIIEDESCDILENATLLLERIKEDYLAAEEESCAKFKRETREVGVTGYPKIVGGQVAGSLRVEKDATANKSVSAVDATAASSPDVTSDRQSSYKLTCEGVSPSTATKSTSPKEDNIRAICDEVIRDSIRSCREADYKMELAKLLSGEAKIELYIEHGKLSNAQRLACHMNRPDYVSSIIEEAAKLNQNHVKTVCQLWLAKH